MAGLNTGRQCSPGSGVGVGWGGGDSGEGGGAKSRSAQRSCRASYVGRWPTPAKTWSKSRSTVHSGTDVE